VLWLALGGSGVAAFAVWLLVRRARAAGREAAARDSAEAALDAKRRADGVGVHAPERTRERLRRGGF
jgi:hypothetical protein